MQSHSFVGFEIDDPSGNLKKISSGARVLNSSVYLDVYLAFKPQQLCLADTEWRFFRVLTKLAPHRD